MKTAMILTAMAVCASATVVAEQHDYYKNLRYPKELVPGVGRNKVQQEGGPNSVGYQRRTVKWWPRQGHDIVDIPAGVPLRTWTRNKGQTDKEALAGACRNWTTSDGETFKAHLIGFRGFGIETPDPRFNYRLAPAAVLRMENGERRAVMVYPPFHSMVSQEDHRFIHEIWQQAWEKLQATQSQDEYIPNDYRVKSDSLVIETKHFTWVSDAETRHKTLWWMRPHEPEKQNAYRQGSLEYAENMWTHIEASGSSMPYWRLPKPWKKYNILVRLAIDGGYAGGGFAACDLRDAAGGPRGIGLSHEWYHGHPGGGWSRTFFGESVCHGGRHLHLPGEVSMFSHNFCYPWRNVSCTQYQCPLWYFALGDNPNWGDGILSVAGCLASEAEPTAYHTIARLGQQRGLWKNGVKGFGDFFGEYAARMVTCDFVMQYAIRSKYGMPEISFLQPVYGKTDRYRIPGSEAPRTYGFNIVRLTPAKGATEISVDFDGLHDATIHSDWRACIVAVDGNGRARYSRLWNKGKLDFALRAADKHLWLTVAATPSALPRSPSGNCDVLLAGIHAPRYPWEVTLSGCKPGTPHRRQGDVINLDELYTLNNGNQYLGFSVKNEVPIPLTDDDGPIAQKKLADMDRRITLAAIGQNERIESGQYNPSDWWERGKVRVTEELTRRVKFLQRNAKGHRHANGGGFVADSARVAATAYVGPRAMVLDGARVEDNACIHEHAVVYGPKTVIRDNAKIGGKAWVFGDITVGGNARIIESVTVTTISRSPIGRSRGPVPEGQAEIDGNVVLKGEHILRLLTAKNQKLTGQLVMDYTPGYEGTVAYYELVPGIANLESGVFQHGRIYGRQGLGDGTNAAGLYANWQFDHPKSQMLEDSYVNNNGILYGGPEFVNDDQARCIVFNGTDQYAAAPPSVADFAELTVDLRVKRSGNKGGRLFDFGTGDEECFYLETKKDSGMLTLTARHQGKQFQLTASEAIPGDRWNRVRVTMDGVMAAIYINGKRIARQAFAFQPRTVYVPDHVEGNFIACSRNEDQFFQGRMDHFRIYRTVHDNFSSVGPPPFALTLLQEWSENDQDRADAWEGRKRATVADLSKGEYGQIQEEIKRLNAEKSELYQATPRDKLEKLAREAQRKGPSIDQRISEAFSSLPGSVKVESVIKELRRPIDAFNRQISESREYLKIADDIKALGVQRQEIEKAIGERPNLQRSAAAADMAEEAMRTAEARIAQLPELKKSMEQFEQEQDPVKKRVLQGQHRRLVDSRKLSDHQWQKADVARRRIANEQRDDLRLERGASVSMRKTNIAIRRLQEQLKALTARRKASNPEIFRLEKTVRMKQNALDIKRAEYVESAKTRAKDDYKKAGDAFAAARQAVEDEKQRSEQTKEILALVARIGVLQKEQVELRDVALSNAKLSGKNPHPGSKSRSLWKFQQNLKYHTTADWDHRTREEVQGTVTPTLKQWLLRVRGH
jgi:hypothetical protein